MKQRAGHSDATRAKIGASKHASHWRHRAGDKSGEIQSPSPWEEDFVTPHVRSPYPRLTDEYET